MEPSVKIIYSESSLSLLSVGVALPLGEANRLFEVRDIECQDGKTIENIMYEISYTIDGSPHSYCCSQNLGEGDGSVINHIRLQALDALQTLNASCQPVFLNGSKNPFLTLQKSYDNMLNRTLPELEAYCIAYKVVDTINSYNINNCNAALLSGINNITSFIKTDTNGFIGMLDEIIAKNIGNTALISSIEVLIINSQRYAQLVNKSSLEELLKEATQKATLINPNSVLNCLEPCEEAELS